MFGHVPEKIPSIFKVFTHIVNTVLFARTNSNYYFNNLGDHAGKDHQENLITTVPINLINKAVLCTIEI